jgi:hypothetical protein
MFAGAIKQTQEGIDDAAIHGSDELQHLPFHAASGQVICHHADVEWTAQVGSC